YFFSSRRRHTRFSRDWSSDVCSSDLGAGKTTWAKAQAQAGDTVIDLDECFREVCGAHGHEADRVNLDAALRLRNHKIADLTTKRSEERRVGIDGRSQ